MPLYEYKCSGCGKTFEVLQKFSDQPLKVHKACGGAVKRLISPSAFKFKGTGWYATDYAHGHDGNGRNGRGPKSESAAAKPVESKPASIPDPASKPES